MKQPDGRSEGCRYHGARARSSTLQAFDSSDLIGCVKVCNPVTGLLWPGWKFLVEPQVVWAVTENKNDSTECVTCPFAARRWCATGSVRRC